MHEWVKTYEGKDKLEDIIQTNSDAINDATKRCIIYTAMIVAGADGYSFLFLFIFTKLISLFQLC